METVKFKLKKGRVLFFQGSFILISLIGLMVIFNAINLFKNKPIDAENFVWLYAYFAIGYFVFGYLNTLLKYLTLRKIKKIWGNSDTIEIPRNEFVGIQDNWADIIIRTNNHRFRINKYYFEDLDSVTQLPPYPFDKNFKYLNQPIYYFYGFGIFLFAIASFSMINPFEGKYDLKYAIPEDFRYAHNFPEDEGRNQCILIDSNEVRLESPWAFKLADKVFNREALKLLTTGTPIKIKVRTKDYEKYLKTGKFEKRLHRKIRKEITFLRTRSQRRHPLSKKRTERRF